MHLSSDMIADVVVARSSRAARLRVEAANCIAIAVAKNGEGFAVDLIDEAARLAARANELEDAVKEASPSF
jgi:hypothetical protein